MTDIDETDSETPGGLTPHEARPSRVRRGRRRLIPWLLTVGVVVAVLFLVANLLGDAALFFYSADEAVERRVELGEGGAQPLAIRRVDTFLREAEANQPVYLARGDHGRTEPVAHRGGAADERFLLRDPLPLARQQVKPDVAGVCSNP